jgi:twitching motility two-component system response regulator PilH
MTIRKVLIVDDSDTDLKNLAQIVSGAGYQVVTAKTGKEAVAKAKSEHPDAILLDVIMPDMNGFQACRSLTSDAETKGIPVVLVSSKGEKTDKVWGEEQGAKGYVTKPYTSDQILGQLRAL